jgi:endoglucanase
MTTHIDPFALNQRLGRGVNIIGYDPLWQSRQLGRLQAKHLRLIREAGFNHVRINLHPFKFMPSEPPYAIEAQWLETLDWVVAQCQENGLLVVLDMHEFIALGEDPINLKPKYLAAWRQFAERYKNAPETVIFELLNEPNKALTPALWNSYLLEPYDLVRQSNPERTLIIGPAWWNGMDYLPQLELPKNEQNLIVTVHYYHPMPFTHQGAGWTEYVDRLGVHWLGSPEEQQAVVNDLAKAQAWAAAHHRPLYLGEFGAYDKGDMPSRVRYTSCVARQAEALGWSWAYWQFDSDFIVYDIDADRWVEPIRSALIPPA